MNVTEGIFSTVPRNKRPSRVDGKWNQRGAEQKGTEDWRMAVRPNCVSTELVTDVKPPVELGVRFLAPAAVGRLGSSSHIKLYRQQ